MNTWLAGFQTEITNIEAAVYVLIDAENLVMAEAGAMHMGRTWWPDLKEDDSGHCWIYPDGTVWFSSIILLDDVENTGLRGLKFLDAWTVSGKADVPVLRDDYDNYWEEYTR